ncbi:NUDIX domain-containing protein [Sphingomonas sp. LHG3406-1]|uniref:NUDIX domain-containing protein n=1 Tax=Sphingomonas sp. LHG3406-1 TaxID=2804617 RepID=UPI002617CB0E|nr:NUDIX domain-containing protein [Sphingomonas sp. LHG3406-1]
MNRLLQLGWSARRRLLGLLRLRTRGVKIALFDEAGALLLVRNSYGNSALWVFPGGGAGLREDELSAAKRELHEEVGIDAVELTLIGRYESAAEGKRDRISLYSGWTAGPLMPDSVEIAEARFFAMDALPSATSPATLRRIEEIRRGGPFGGAW